MSNSVIANQKEISKFNEKKKYKERNGLNWRREAIHFHIQAFTEKAEVGGFTSWIHIKFFFSPLIKTIFCENLNRSP